MSIVVLFSLLVSPNHVDWAQASPSLLLLKQIPPLPPATPPPNRTTPGGSLSASRPCQLLEESLVALVPIDNPVLTTSAYPTFLFYVPYQQTTVKFGEFSLLAGPDERTLVYRSRFTLPETPGIVSLSLPTHLPTGLVPGKDYHWYFKLYCQNQSGSNTEVTNTEVTNTEATSRFSISTESTSTEAANTEVSSAGVSSADLQVDGWVYRVALNPERQGQIATATPTIWYDALAQLAQQLVRSPQEQTVRQRWHQLLDSIDSANLSGQPIVGEVKWIEQ